MRTIIFADIHGCLQELSELLEIVDLHPEDHLILLGDLVDRGPDSAGVVKLLYQVSQQQRVTLIRGNHEHKHILTMYYGYTFEDHDDIMKTQQALSTEERKWLFDGDLFYRNRELDLICVHGGIPKEMAKLPWPKFDDNIGQSKRFARRLMFLRFENFKLWAKNYNGKYGTAFFGHQVFEKPQKFPYAWGLDTGCVFGGSLSAAVISSDTPERVEFLSVPAKQTYCP